jgi:hypothetical protein
MREAEGRNGIEAEFLGCHYPPVAGNDLVLVADQNRVGESKPGDAVGNLAYLFAGMLSGIAGIGSKETDRKHLDTWR